MAAPADAADLLYGVSAIATYLGIRPRQAKHRLTTGEIPSFRIGENICARRSLLTEWLDAQSRAGRA
ncbi:hypothetical protein NS226_15330 [Aureimonas ureilytica]|uniref:Helix-turn-helix domain-containing protein n=1 Tax=Aureimonas ureilytica TaxID=401562 RepID=A0A175R878_9HYPH|nr:hypothetical protein NS226_15330 [Aureimonas ureilytica]